MRRISRICLPFVSLWVGLWVALLALPAWALSGADVAYQINQRYQKTPSKCFVANPVQECSGVLMRPAPTPGGDLFALSADETANGMARFDFVRRDIETTHLSDSVGFILAPRPEAVGNGKPYDLLCGCPPPGASNPSPCNDCPGQPNTAGVSLWDPAAPEKIAAQAIYYDVDNGGQLATALEYQRQYFNKSGEWKPILRVAFGAQGTTTFGFDATDQLDVGYATAKALNARYADTRKVCPDGRAAYFCSGVVIRVTGWGTGFKSWNPSPGSVAANGVSFSYIRADTFVERLFWHGNDAGVIHREFAAPIAHPLEMRCIYTRDVGSTPPDRCYQMTSVLCGEMNIHTAQALVSYLLTTGRLCAFDPSPIPFYVSFEARPLLPQEYKHAWNEAIIAIWPQDIPEQIGIEAFFYMNDDASGTQYVQRDYLSTTGRFMPIVKVDLNATDGQIFTYDLAAQSFAQSGASALPPVPMSPKDIPQ